MERPTEVHIAGLKWDISWDLTPGPEAALCYKFDQKIEIDGTKSETSLRDSLLHEIIHACWRDPLKKRPTEEQVVLTLTPALLSFLRESKNKPVLDFLTHNEQLTNETISNSTDDLADHPSDGHVPDRDAGEPRGPSGASKLFDLGLRNLNAPGRRHHRR